MNDPQDNSAVALRAAPDAHGSTAAIPGNLNWSQAWFAMFACAAAGTLLASILLNRSPDGDFVPVLTLIICLLAAGFDSATSKIPNPITYSAILLGLIINCLPVLATRAGISHLTSVLGAAGPTQALLGFALCGGIGLACFLTAGMGGGDMKLIAAVGALLGLHRAGNVLLWTLAVAVLYSLLNLALSGRLNAVLRAAAVQLLSVIYLKQTVPAEIPSKKTIPLAVPLLLGLLLWRLLPPQTLSALLNV